MSTEKGLQNLLKGQERSSKSYSSRYYVSLRSVAPSAQLNQNSKLTIALISLKKKLENRRERGLSSRSRRGSMIMATTIMITITMTITTTTIIIIIIMITMMKKMLVYRQLHRRSSHQLHKAAINVRLLVLQKF